MFNFLFSFVSFVANTRRNRHRMNRLRSLGLRSLKNGRLYVLPSQLRSKAFMSSNIPRAASATTSKKDNLDITFNDHVAAFKSKTTLELARGYFVYSLCSVNFLVENNMKVSFIHLLSCSVKFFIIF